MSIETAALTTRPPLAGLSCAAIVLCAWASIPQAGTLLVRVRDARSGAPMNGAFVQVGPAPDLPFANNRGTTDADGAIAFSAPEISGPQTVTAGAQGFAYSTVIEAVTDSIHLSLHPQVADSTIYGPKAELSGTTTGITVQNNDGKFDLGFVYPAIRLGDLIGRRTAPIEVPQDTVNFPVVCPTVLPGNIVMPPQTEFLFFQFSKPNYHFFVGDQARYDFVVLAGRLPIASLANLDPNAIVWRKVGAERQIAMNGNRSLAMNCDLTLSNTLTVTVPGAPPGADVEVFSVADVPEPEGALTVLYDTRSALSDTLGHFTLSGLNPTGDLSTSSPYVVGFYGDSSSAQAFQSGRIDRSPLTLPATRTLGDLFLLPVLGQSGPEFHWSDVSQVGVTPAPTWSVATFKLEPTAAGDTTKSRTLWEALVPAGRRSLVLPTLAPGAPPVDLDPTATPAADRILWEQVITDASGTTQGVIDDPYSTLTRFSRRVVEIVPPSLLAVEPPHRPTAPAPARFALAPNPGRGAFEIIWRKPPAPGEPVAWSLLDAAGRAVASGRYLASGSSRERAPWGRFVLRSAGVYFVRLEDRRGPSVRALVMAR